MERAKELLGDLWTGIKTYSGQAKDKISTTLEDNNINKDTIKEKASNIGEGAVKYGSKAVIATK